MQYDQSSHNGGPQSVVSAGLNALPNHRDASIDDTQSSVPPTTEALAGFAGGQSAHRLAGGMGVAWRAGDIVLKPSPNALEARYVAETHAGLRDTPSCRFQRPVPVPGKLGCWEIDGWVAWHWIEGEPAPERAREIVLASRAYHDLLSPLPDNPVFASRTDPWARADRVAWGEASVDYPADYLALLAPLLAAPPPLLPRQVIHADLTGNVVFSPGLAPGIIDPTLYWRPVAFAEAVILVDQCWFTKTLDLTPFADTPAFARMLCRAAARRIAEQPEQVAAHGKDAAEAFAIARRIASWTEAALNRLGSII